MRSPKCWPPRRRTRRKPAASGFRDNFRNPEKTVASIVTTCLDADCNAWIPPLPHVNACYWGVLPCETPSIGCVCGNLTAPAPMVDSPICGQSSGFRRTRLCRGCMRRSGAAGAPDDTQATDPSVDVSARSSATPVLSTFQSAWPEVLRFENHEPTGRPSALSGIINETNC
jgi:hypothetical protein